MRQPSAENNNVLVMGIDASNIRAGGGLTHLGQLLAAMPDASGISRALVWGGAATLARLPERDWLEKRHVRALDSALPARVIWQQFVLPRELRKTGCDVLFSPGGTVPALSGVPVVTLSQNLLPFEARERRRFGVFSWMYWKLLLLHRMQAGSFRRASGVIFLTQYARERVRHSVPVRRDTIISHGIEARFFSAAPDRDSLGVTGDAGAFRLLYVSIVDVYKHQDRVADAVAELHSRGMPVTIDFVGPAYGPALRKLQKRMRRLDPDGTFLRYRGPATFEQLHRVYAGADAFVFASSCENMPNILVEAMAAGLPIACSNRGPMPEVLGDAGVYFDPERPGEIADAIRLIHENPRLRATLSAGARERAKAYSWERCARETLWFIVSTMRSRCDS